MRFELPVAIFVLENRDLVGSTVVMRRWRRNLVENCSQISVVLDDLQSGGKGILQVLNHPQPPALVEVEVQRLTDDRFAGDCGHLQSLHHLEMSKRLFE